MGRLNIKKFSGGFYVYQKQKTTSICVCDYLLRRLFYFYRGRLFKIGGARIRRRCGGNKNGSAFGQQP
jgi:hypothetical protein